MKQYAKRNRPRLRLQDRARRLKIKLDGIKQYGGKCVCCGISEVKFLTIDHINGRSKEKKYPCGSKPTGLMLWVMLKRLGWPKSNYQLLCFNCNCAKGIYGTCPHKNGGGDANQR
jgi:5-methylcytosine-specific restriction endonuclease McrA